ncbi:MAG: CHAT domain-containing protein [Bacteroidales bacterium]|nr:CHAT domain-containing protein [Bacteroidales bacterium]
MFAGKNTDCKLLSKLAYNNVLYSKGILLSTEQRMSSLIEEDGDEIAKNTYNELKDYRLQLNKLYESSEKSHSNSVVLLEKKVTDLEKELSFQLKEYSSAQIQHVEWQDVVNKLNNREAAIEFVSYTDADSIVYDAYLLKKDYTSPKIIRLIKIGATTSLNKPDVYYSTELSNHIWGKMSTELKDVKSIYFAPAGDLYSIAIEALPLWDDSAKYVCDRWNFYRLSSTRQLVLAKPHRKYTKAAVYGGLTYKLSNNEEAADTVNAGNTDKTTRETTLYTTFDVKSLNTRGGISELPATYTEAINIDKMLSAAKVPDKLETKKAGTEESFKGMSGKGFDLLHIATHGFYWSESNASKLKRLSFLQENSSSENRSAEDKALTRSGLLLTGAANSILGIGLPKGAEDGVLTAGEVSQLNLSGLDLVVMSACQTGLGELSGDGVFGLQRGFKKAGANALLMTLCKVDDNATSLLMSRFYRNLIDSGMTKHDAFVDAQKFVRDYTITKTINVEGEISDSDMKLMEQYGGELPEPVDGKIAITLHPYKDPRFWAVFILEDGLDGNKDALGVINHRQTRDKNLSEVAINNMGTSAQSSFDRWSGKYKAIWGFPRKYDYDLDGVEGDFEIYKDSTGHYKGRVQLFNGPMDENTNHGESLIGNITVKNNGSSLVVYLGEFKLDQGDGVESPEKNVYRVNNVKPKDEAFVFEYKGKGQYIIKPIGKLANIIEYNEYRIVKEDKDR